MNVGEFLEKLEKIIGAAQDAVQNIPMMKFTEHLAPMPTIMIAILVLYKMIMVKENTKNFLWSAVRVGYISSMPI